MGISSISLGALGPPPVDKTAPAKSQKEKDLDALNAQLDKSPIQKSLDAQKKKAEKFVKYDESEDFLRMKAFEISGRIKTFKNLGLTVQYEAAQAEGAAVVQKYKDLLKAGKIGVNADTQA